MANIFTVGSLAERLFCLALAAADFENPGRHDAAIDLWLSVSVDSIAGDSDLWPGRFAMQAGLADQWKKHFGGGKKLKTERVNSISLGDC